MPVLDFIIPSPIQVIENVFPFQSFVKRDDLIHHEVSGNKYRKLKYLIQAAIHDGKKGILTFGGPFSNHIYATAALSNLCELSCVGIIRGDEDLENPTIRFAIQKGMNVHFVNRKDYKDNGSGAIQDIISNYPDYAIIPLGGYHPKAMKGVQEIIDELTFIPDYIACAVGTGTTAAGLLTGIAEKGWPTKLLAFSSLKNEELRNQILALAPMTDSKNLFMIDSYTRGGYAKLDEELVNYHEVFFEKTKIKLDPIYTLKMMFGLEDMCKANYFSPKDSVIIYHSGGIQGWDGIEYVKQKSKNR